jgi:glutamate dehydrogenase
MIESRGAKALARQNRLIRFFEAKERLNREHEALPSEEDIERRIEKKVGLTRPEIAVLVSHTKLYLYEQILASTLPESPFLHHYLMDYFPQPLQEGYASFIEQHPLKRELIATSEANFLVNRLGTTFFFELERRSGKPLIKLMELFVQFRGAWRLEDYWVRIEALEGSLSYQVQNHLFSLLILFSEKVLEWILKGGSLQKTEPILEPLFSHPPLGEKVHEKEIERLQDFLVKLTHENELEYFKEFLTRLKEML